MASVRLPPPMDLLDESQIQTIQQRLYHEFKVEMPLMLWQGRHFLRVACQVYTRPADIERAADAIYALQCGLE